MYTGDDFNYTDLIEGNGTNYSDALLGIFTAIAPAVSPALEALAKGENEKYRDILEPTVPLSREIFKKPTQYYKAGITFLAWLNGLQTHFSMIGGMQSSREITHYAEIFRLADNSNLIWTSKTFEDGLYKFWKINYLEHNIWGATAAILVCLASKIWNKSNMALSIEGE